MYLCECVCTSFGRKGIEDTLEQSICILMQKFYQKDNVLHEIHFLVRLGSLKEVNVAGENSNTSDFDENKNKTRY